MTFGSFNRFREERELTDELKKTLEFSQRGTIFTVANMLQTYAAYVADLKATLTAKFHYSAAEV